MSTLLPTDIVECCSTVEFERVPYRAPLKFGGRIVSSGWLMNVQMQVVTRNGRMAVGRGSMPCGNVWAWPSAVLSPDQTEQSMLGFAKALSDRLQGRCLEAGHPLELSVQLHLIMQKLAVEVPESLGFAESLPPLAQLVVASPFDAAIHDGFGRALGCNAFDALTSEFCSRDLGAYLDEQFSGEYLDRYTLRAPVSSLPLYHLVGALDPLTPQDVTSRPDDTLPVTLGEWILADELTHLKIKLAGDQLDWDVARVLAVESAAAEAQAVRQCDAWFYSCDFNEKCSSAEYVVEFLRRVREGSVRAFERIQYIEQPTSRNLAVANAPRMHAAAAIRPVVIDEALVSYESLLLAREQGYSGIALKACKGQSDSLLMAAAAQKFGMFLCVQDLTCPGASFLHSCALSSRIPGVAAVEGNARQYCPGANVAWSERFPGIFRLQGGRVQTGCLTGAGLGY
ncbi:MAG: enolase C-terminal domain-like protein [Planctomycetaceae bacterium]